MKKKILLLGLCGLMSISTLTACVSAKLPKNFSSEDLMEDVKIEEVDTKTALNEENNKKMTEFGTKIFQNTLSQEGENTMVSPLSIASALAMVANGADGETLAEMENTLGFTKDELNSYLNAYVKSLPRDEAYKFMLGNSIWVNQGILNPNPEFLQVNKNYLNSSIYSSKFEDKTLKEINSWVSENTQGMINSIMSQIDPNAAMYLINALSLDADWEKPYDEGQVQEGDFTKADGQVEKVEYMYGKEYSYIQGENETGFSKAYKDGKYSFVALLPNEGQSIDEYISTLTGEKIQGLLNNTSEEEVITALPKFNSTYGLSLNDSLKKMGINQGFSPEHANFTKMGESNGNIFINSVVHKTFISVHEKGTEAGAVTAVTMETTSAPAQTPKQVYLNRPFVYMVIDTENNVPIFIGNIVKIN